MICGVLSCGANSARAVISAVNSEFPETPHNHWAYAAMNYLIGKGWIETAPVFSRYGEPSRYEWAVATARLMQKIHSAALDDKALSASARAEMTDINDAVAALKREFARELSELGVRDPMDNQRVGDGRIAAQTRLTISPSILHRTGAANPKNETNSSQTLVSRDGKLGWAYAAIEELNRRRDELGCSLRRDNFKMVHTRYDMAVATARLMMATGRDLQAQKFLPATKDEDINDTLAALMREFKPELQSFGVPSAMKALP